MGVAEWRVNKSDVERLRVHKRSSRNLEQRLKWVVALEERDEGKVEKNGQGSCLALMQQKLH